MRTTCLKLACSTLLAALMLPIGACSNDPELVAARITAVLEGRVRNGLTRMPLADVTVRILDARGANRHLEVTTDDEGRFRAVFNGAGRFTYQVERDGFARVASTVTFDPNDFAVEGTNGTYTVTQLFAQDLFPLTGTLRARVYGTQFRDWIADAPITLNYFSSIDDPSLPTGGSTDDEGTIEFTGLPAGTALTLTVRATDRNGDGVLDTNGTSTNVTLESGATTEVFVGPVGAFNGPGVLWSNVDDMRTWPADANFTFVFRTPMDTDPSATIVNLRDYNIGTAVATTTMWNTDGTQLTISPVQDLVAGREYQISFTAWSQLAESIGSGSYRFRVAGGADGRPAITGLQWLDDPTEQELFDTAFRIGLDPTAGVDRIRVYGRNSVRSSDWVFIQDVYPTAGFPKMEYTINIVGNAATLLSSFPNDTVTFFGRGETLELAAAAVIQDVEGPLSTPIALTDEKCVDVTLSTGTNNVPNVYFDNTSGSAGKPILIQVVANNDYFSETSQAAITIANGPFSTNSFVLSTSALATTRTNRGTFQLTGEIPADRDAQLDLITVNLGMLEDPSGNPVCQTSVSAYTPGRRGSGGIDPVTWNFQSGNQDWTATGGFMRGSGPSYSGTSTIWSTGLTSARADNTTSTLRSPRMLLPSSYTLSWYDRRDLDPSDVLSFRQITDDETRPISASQWFFLGNDYYQVTVGGVLTGVWSQIEIGFVSGTPGGGAGTATATGYSIDDVSLTGTWDRNLFYDGTN